MLNHIILTTIVGLAGLALHLWMRRAAHRDRVPNADIERWEDDGGPTSAHSN